MPSSQDEALNRKQDKLRATQTLVSHMSYCWRHPSLTVLEVAWRWLFGIPFLIILWNQTQQILSRIPPASAGLDRLNYQNPWVSSVLLADAASAYRPAVAEVLLWLAPLAVIVWAIVSGLGRTFVFWRMSNLETGRTERPFGYFLRRSPALMMLQGLWMLALLGCFWLWYSGVSWAAGTHITSANEPDLVGYLCWLIFLSLGCFTAWALLSWVLAIAPLLLIQEGASNPVAAILHSFRLGRQLSGKLVEVNLVMAIVKIALIVLAMVFSAAPLPFSDQFGLDFMHLLYVTIAVAFLVASDSFQVVRLRSFQSLHNYYRDEVARREQQRGVTSVDL